LPKALISVHFISFSGHQQGLFSGFPYFGRFQSLIAQRSFDKWEPTSTVFIWLKGLSITGIL
jgi:hypothetical protein